MEHNENDNADGIYDWRNFNFGQIKEINFWWHVGMRLTFVSAEIGTFDEFVNLVELDLNYNKLAEIKENLFQNLNKLKILNLGQNRISKIHLNGFKG